MKAVAFLFIIVVFALLVALAAGYVNTALAKRRASRSPWDCREVNENDCLNVYAIKEGQDPVFLGGVAWSSPDFDYKIEEVRSDAKQRVLAANNGKARALTKRELTR